MDPRYLRSQQQLRAAVLTLAAASPIESITVAEVCRAAGITRDTFYRHASSPTALLTDALAAEIAETIAPATTGPGAVPRSERMLLTHIAEHAAVYRGAMRSAELRGLLERILCEGLLDYARTHPDIVPQRIAEGGDEGLMIAAVYAASGTVAAIERWLRTDPLDVDLAVRWILAASPEFWLREPRG